MKTIIIIIVIINNYENSTTNLSSEISILNMTSRVVINQCDIICESMTS